MTSGLESLLIFRAFHRESSVIERTYMLCGDLLMMNKRFGQQVWRVNPISFVNLTARSQPNKREVIRWFRTTQRGVVPKAPIFKSHFKSCLATIQQLERDAPKRNNLILGMTCSSGSVEVDEISYKRRCLNASKTGQMVRTSCSSCRLVLAFLEGCHWRSMTKHV